MEPKFKVGDKVLITDDIKKWNCCSSEMHQYIGKTFTIKKIQDSTAGSDEHTYTLKEIEYEYHWDCSGFQLVEDTEEKEPEYEYNIGDVVEILPRIHEDTDYPHTYVDDMCSLVGNKYTIIDKYKCDYKSGKIKDDGFIYKLSETGNWNWSSSMFKKAEEEKFQKQKKRTEKLEPAVGEVFKYEGKSYICIESNMNADETCKNCSFRTVNCSCFTCSRKRKDHKDVYFQEIPNLIFDTSSIYSEQNCGIATNVISTHPLHSIGLGLTLSPMPWTTAEDKKDSGKSIIEYIMGLNKKPNYKLKFKL